MSSIAIWSQYGNQSLAVGRHVASQLGFRLVSMQDLVKTTAAEFQMPEAELAAVFKKRSGLKGVFAKKPSKGLACIEQQLCRLIAEDRLVFVGHVGLTLCQMISHVLKALVLDHPGGGSGPADPGVKEWFQTAYQEDLEDPNLYDLTVNLTHMDVAEAGNIIINTLQHHKFTPMTYSLKCMDNLELSGRVKTLLVEKYPDVAVKAHDGAVYVFSSGFNRGRQKAALQTKQTLLGLEGVSHVEVHGDKKLFDSITCGQVR
ncbi:MAG: cytidylate kinase family protein [Desulfobacterales bacterium]|jgi:hypothetical protein|nr:cytidylate kinase family protein [Desulfobacterales bacterium]